MAKRAIIVILAVCCLCAAIVYFRSLLGPEGAPSGLLSQAADAELDEAKQKEIWDAEHATFKIENRLGKRFLAAWTERDVSGISLFLSSEFRASLPATSDRVSRTQAGVTESIVTWNDDEMEGTTAEEFARWLIASLDDFELIERSQFKVLDIQRANDGCWNFRLLLTAHGVGTDSQLISFVSHHDVQCSYSDNQELDSGSTLRDWRVAATRLRRGEQRMFREVTSDAKLDDLPLPDNWELPAGSIRQYQFQMAVDDYDLDGYLDIALMTEDGDLYLFHFETGLQFSNQAEALGLRSRVGVPSSMVGWIDYDNDGYPDLVAGSRLYHNERGRLFRDVTEDSGLALEMRAQGCTVADFDCDGLLDLYVLYQHPYGDHAHLQRVPMEVGWIGDHSSGGENQLWRNMGGGRFAQVTHSTDAGGGHRHTFAAAWLFADDDRFPDLYIANDLGRNTLLQNRNGEVFEDVTEQSGTGDFATSMGVATGDVDNDGSPEIYVANMYSKMGRRIIDQVSDADYPPGVYEQLQGSCAGSRIYRRETRASVFDDRGSQWAVNDVGWAYAPTFADFDNDGWLDIYATTGFLSFDRTKPDG